MQPSSIAFAKAFAIAAIGTLALTFTGSDADARSSGGRVHYGGGHHTKSHGGYYVGGSGSSHKGGHYSNAATGNRYGTHK